MSYKRLTQLRQHIIIGVKQTVRALNNNELNEVVIAKDASPEITNPVVEVAKEQNVLCTYVESKEELGKACGIDVSTSAVGIKLN